MRRTGQDFHDRTVFREFPAGAREQQRQDSHPLRAVGANQTTVTRTGFPPLQGSLLIRKTFFNPMLSDDGNERPDIR